MLSPQQKTDIQYPFLSLLTESKATLQGVSLADKTVYALYRTIQKKNSVASANQNGLFTIGYPVEGLIDAPREKITSLLRRLSDDRLIAQIFRLEYHATELRLIPCYIAVTPFDLPASVYKAVLRVSIVNVDAFLKATLPVLNLEQMEAACKADAVGERVTPKTHPGILIDPFEIVQANRFDFPPAPKLISTSVADMKEELIRSQKITNLPSYGLMPLRKSEILERIEVAEDVLRERVIEYYQKSNETLKNIFDEIFIEESIYEMDPFALDTKEFIQRIAKIIKKEADTRSTADNQKNIGNFVIETIIVLGDKAKNVIQENIREENLQYYRKIREKLIQPTGALQEIFLFIKEKDRNQIHPEILTYLLKDKAIINEKWECPDGTVWAFVRKDVESIIHIVNQLQEQSPIPNWQALTFRNLLEAHEEELYELFDSPEFLLPYGNLLRRVYINYMPWYYRFLLFLKIEWFMDRSYQSAKTAIRKEQQIYTKQNENSRVKVKEEKEAAKRYSLERLRVLSVKNKILSQLDYFYFEKKRVPTIQEIQNNVDFSDSQSFFNFITSEGFQHIAPLKKEQGWEGSLLLYPKDSAWSIRSSRLKELAERILLENISESNKEMRLRFKRLLRFLRYELAPIKEKGKSSEEDPYKRFGKALQDYEAKQKHEAAESLEAVEVSQTQKTTHTEVV